MAERHEVNAYILAWVDWWESPGDDDPNTYPERPPGVSEYHERNIKARTQGIATVRREAELSND